MEESKKVETKPVEKKSNSKSKTPKKPVKKKTTASKSKKATTKTAKPKKELNKNSKQTSKKKAPTKTKATKKSVKPVTEEKIEEKTIEIKETEKIQPTIKKEEVTVEVLEEKDLTAIEKETEDSKTSDVIDVEVIEKSSETPEIKEDNEKKDFGFAGSNELDDDFSDAKVENAVVEIEEKTAEEELKEANNKKLSEVTFYKEDAEVEENIPSVARRAKKKDLKTYEYKDEKLEAIEYSRDQFNRKIKKHDIIKWVSTALALTVLFLGWFLPQRLFAKGDRAALYITLGITLATIVFIFAFSYFSKKTVRTYIGEYFDNLYNFTYDYALQNSKISDLQGSGNSRVDENTIANTNLYKNVVRAPNRACYSFKLDNEIKCSICDCSFYVKGNKNTQRPVFVGKMLVAENNWKKPDTIIYLKGNKRAMPPTNLDAYHLMEETKDMVICCSDYKNTLNNIDKSFIKKLKTNKTLVDCVIKLTKGTTTFMLGYEDTLMVPVHDRPFNPAATEEFKQNIEACFEIAEHFNKKH